jgi:glycerate dehydrogenase
MNGRIEGNSGAPMSKTRAKIVVVDGYTANPGDLDWQPFLQLGECTIHDRSTPAEVVVRAAGAEVILTNKAIVDAAAIAALPALRYIGVTATGYNNVDVAAARARRIPVCNVPEYGTANVAQAVFALLLELTNRTGHHAETVRQGRWSASKDFCYWDGSLIELSGLTLGIVGYGRIGQAVARIARAFGMRILACRRTGEVGTDAEAVDLDTLFRSSDVISLHCPLTPETRGLVDAARIAQMKPTAFLINTSRGPLIQEADLVEALNAGRIAGAGLDVLSVEPPAPDHPLIRARNCIITPHIAWATKAARARLLEASAENLRAFLAGAPRNVVNRES